MKIGYALMIGCILVAACMPIPPSLDEVGPAISPLEIPQRSAEDAQLAPALVGPWIWVYADKIYYEYIYGYPEYSVRFQTSYYSQCQSAQFKFDDNHYTVIDKGHWRTYFPYGELMGSRDWHLNMGWIVTKLTVELEDVMNPDRYIALCRTY